MIAKPLVLIFAVMILQGCYQHPKRPPRIDQEAQIKELLSCQPNKPLSKGELYEQAMVDYLRKETDFAWEADYWIRDYQLEKPLSERLEFNGDEVSKLCGLTYDWLGKAKEITKDRCFPYQIRKYDQFQDLAYKKQNKSFEQFIIDSEAKVYRLDRDPPIYKAENYNKDVDFVLIHNRSYEELYPKDCCKLVSHQEVVKIDKLLSKKALIFNERLTNLNFLMIKTWIFGRNDNGKLLPESVYKFYAVSPCGKILP